MQESHNAFSAGQQVVVRDERWTVLHAESFESTCVLRLRGVDSTNRDELQSVLAPFDVVSDVNAATRIRQRSRRAVMAAVAEAVAGAVPWSECWTAANAHLDLHAWQLEPAVAAVTGTTRILLGDAVGLGKTIQAGLLVAELLVRGLAERALILTPASIRDQWADELRSRFGLTIVVFDQSSLAESAATLPPDVNPWSLAPVIISSIDLVKRPEVRAALHGVPFDVLVVDEAHHLTRGSDRGALVADVASRTPWVVLATATPHSGDDRAFDFLTGLGDVGGDALRIFRRSTPRRASRLHRSSRLLMVRPTAAERVLLDATVTYAKTLAARSHPPAAQLVASVIARRAAASAAAVSRTLARRAALLKREPPATQQSALPWEDDDTRDDDVADAVLSTAGLADVSHEVDWLLELLALARAAAANSSKVNVVRRMLRRTGEQLLIFSEFRDVALDVAAALADITTVAALHGGLSPRERRAAVQAFNSGAVRTLVATDAAGEGLNLHLRCRVVVNVELPWTPSRLEQRIGRVDRMGQTRRVHAIHLAHRDSYEGTVIARLERRRARAARAFDAAAGITPRAMLTRRLQRAFRATDTPSSVYATRPLDLCADRHRGGRPALLLLFAVPLLDSGGGFVQRELIPLRLRARARRLPRHLIRILADAGPVLDCLDDEAQRRAVSAQEGMRRVGDALDKRLTALIATLDRRSVSSGFQASLFDRRQEQAAERHASELATLRAHLARRRDAARRLQRLRAGRPRLVAAWLGGL